MRKLALLLMLAILAGCSCRHRYEVAISGNAAVLIDTWTGDTWWPHTDEKGNTSWVSGGPRLATTKPVR